MFNKVGAAYMFVMAGGSLFFSLGVFGSEAGTFGTAIGAATGLVFTLGFVALGFWLLRQR
jgi:hypothetical protein